jgi:DTW domain-containing protein YfiP
MQQYRFWATVTVAGTKQRREFVFTAASWTEARRMMSAAMKQPIPA